MALAMVWVTFRKRWLCTAPARPSSSVTRSTKSHYDAAFWTTVGGSLLLAAVFAGVAPFLAKINGTPQLTQVCLALAPAILLNSLVVVPDAILRREMRFRTLSHPRPDRRLRSAVRSAWVGAIIGWGVWPWFAHRW